VKPPAAIAGDHPCKTKENFFSDEWRERLNEAFHVRKYSLKTKKLGGDPQSMKGYQTKP
jgi:hypothetical protein